VATRRHSALIGQSELVLSVKQPDTGDEFIGLVGKPSSTLLARPNFSVDAD